jgi:hypothetical protein
MPFTVLKSPAIWTHSRSRSHIVNRTFIARPPAQGCRKTLLDFLGQRRMRKFQNFKYTSFEKKFARCMRVSVAMDL